MTRLLEWLLDLHDIRLGRDVPLLLKWQNEIAGWVLLSFALVALAWVTVVYRRERMSSGRRLTLAVVRCGVIALVAAMLCRPSLVWQRNRVEPSHVAVLLDTSLSMTTRDRYSDEAAASAIARGAELADPRSVEDRSRLDLVQAAVAGDNAAPLRRLLEHNAIQLYTFSGAAEPQGYADSEAALAPLVESVQSAKAEGMSTDLARAIRQVIDKAQGRRLAAVILASDGRSTQPTSLQDALDLAAGRQIPIFPLRIGSPDPVRDIEVGPVRAQDGVFVNDVLAVEAQISARGLSEPTPVRVALVDERSGTTVATQTVSLDSFGAQDKPSVGATTVELHTKPTQGGTTRYRVEVAPLPGETNIQNNAERVDVTILEGGLRVLFVEGYPRYEYRYLKNALLREQTMQMRGLLIEADEQFVQEGTEPIGRFPDTPEELSRYDVVLFGDVDPRGGWLTAAQMNMLLDFVGNEGGGFGLIAGERAAPHRYLGTPLEKLIPVSIDPGFLGRYDAPLVSGYRPRLTPEGRRSRIFRFAADRAASAALFDSLPELYWVARTLGPKPGASVLAEHPTLRTAAGPMPVVVTGRYGAGKLFFQATDDTWRWRRHNGELLHDSYWVQVARELMRDTRASQDRRYVLRTDRRTYAYGEPVRVQVEFFDAQLLSQQHDTLPVAVEVQSSKFEDRKDMNVAPSLNFELRTSDFAARFDVHRIGPQSSIFEGAYVPPHPGGFSLEAADISPRPGDRSASVLVRVERPDLEARRPEADYEALERIAAATGGRVLELDQLESEFATVRDRSVQIPDDVVETLWDSKLVLVLFVLMISTEWGLRKAFGLL